MLSERRRREKVSEPLVVTIFSDLFLGSCRYWSFRIVARGMKIGNVYRPDPRRPGMQGLDSVGLRIIRRRHHFKELRLRSGQIGIHLPQANTRSMMHHPSAPQEIILEKIFIAVSGYARRGFPTCCQKSGVMHI